MAFGTGRGVPNSPPPGVGEGFPNRTWAESPLGRATHTTIPACFASGRLSRQARQVRPAQAVAACTNKVPETVSLATRGIAHGVSAATPGGGGTPRRVAGARCRGLLTGFWPNSHHSASLAGALNFRPTLSSIVLQANNAHLPLVSRRQDNSREPPNYEILAGRDSDGVHSASHSAIHLHRCRAHLAVRAATRPCWVQPLSRRPVADVS